MSQKTMQIADSLHGTIHISTLEKQIISTQVINRLHNVLQNSTVYLTYPSNQTKRFEHSLGAMHLGGKIFQHSIVNASLQVRDEFLDGVNDILKNIKKDNYFNAILRLGVGDEYVELLNSCETMMIDEPLYKANTPHIVEVQHQFAYAFTYQSVRLAALLHDMGHPPFSHVTEFALKEVWEELNKKPEQERTVREKSFLEVINGEKESADLHEQIGNCIADRLMEHVMVKPKSEEEARRQIFYQLVRHIVNHIYQESDCLFKGLHGIIAGAIDCDRLDYVTRDMKNSGFNHGVIEYDRLICSMKLMKKDENFIFCTDVRTLGTVEDFFNRRWALYKYVIYHHRVIKTDYLLGKVVAALALNYLSSPDEDTPQRAQVLPLDISGLWRAVKEVNSNKTYFNALIQWDDSWLLTVLRKEFFMEYQGKKTVVSQQLEELLSNRKHYRSIIKRMDDFQQIDASVVENFTVDWDKVVQTVGDGWKPLIEKLNVQIEAFKGDEWKSYPPAHGFFLGRIKRFLETLAPERPLFQETVEKTLGILTQQYDFEDWITVFKKLKTGLENPAYMCRNNEVIDIDQVSRIKMDLRQNQTVFPIFYVYVISKKDFPYQDFLRDIGKELAKQLIVLINVITGKIE